MICLETGTASLPLSSDVSVPALCYRPPQLDRFGPSFDCSGACDAAICYNAKSALKHS